MTIMNFMKIHIVQVIIPKLEIIDVIIIGKIREFVHLNFVML